MSNGDDVLDNWEEIDEAVLNSPVQTLESSSATTCERITEGTSTVGIISPTTATISSRPYQMKVLQRSDTQESVTKPLDKSPLDDMSATFQPVMMVLHRPQDEYQSANYTAPIANQTVKILRRPTQSTEIRNNGIRPRQPIKTLQQREQEYAEARLRILGSAKNPEDEGQLNEMITTTSAVTTMTNSTQATSTAQSVVALTSNSGTNIATTAKINSPKIQVGANQYNNQYLQQQQKYQQHYQQLQQQQQQSYFLTQQQQPQSPAYNNNRTYNMNSLLALGSMGAIGQPAQYQTTQTQQQHLKYQQYHQKSPQQPHKTQQQPQQTWSPVVGGSVSSSSIRQQENDTILRLPRGPDGTTGFQIHR